MNIEAASSLKGCKTEAFDEPMPHHTTAKTGCW
ncbi:hypothetical protein V6Z12_A13G208400 [Gossypium hirsutum]